MSVLNMAVTTFFFHARQAGRFVPHFRDSGTRVEMASLLMPRIIDQKHVRAESTYPCTCARLRMCTFDCLHEYDREAVHHGQDMGRAVSYPHRSLASCWTSCLMRSCAVWSKGWAASFTSSPQTLPVRARHDASPSLPACLPACLPHGPAPGGVASAMAARTNSVCHTPPDISDVISSLVSHPWHGGT